MCKPSDRLGRKAGAAGLLALTLATMLLPSPTLAGVSTLEGVAAAASGPGATPRRDATYQIRCWQEGRLLFEENGISLLDGNQYSRLITGSDRQGRAVYVAETRNATCLIRQAAADRAALPR